MQALHYITCVSQDQYTFPRMHAMLGSRWSFSSQNPVPIYSQFNTQLACFNFEIKCCSIRLHRMRDSFILKQSVRSGLRPWRDFTSTWISVWLIREWMGSVIQFLNRLLIIVTIMALKLVNITTITTSWFQDSWPYYFSSIMNRTFSDDLPEHECEVR